MSSEARYFTVAGQAGHIAKTCGMGKPGSKHPMHLFVLCNQVDKAVSRIESQLSAEIVDAAATSVSSMLGEETGPVPESATGTDSGETIQNECFVRRFIVPLSRARPDFHVSALVEGRLDVGCRYITSPAQASPFHGLHAYSKILVCIFGRVHLYPRSQVDECMWTHTSHASEWDAHALQRASDQRPEIGVKA